MGHEPAAAESPSIVACNVYTRKSEAIRWHRGVNARLETGGKLVVHLPDGGTAELEPPDGFVMWHEAWTHRVQNVGTTDIRAIIVEPK